LHTASACSTLNAASVFIWTEEENRARLEATERRMAVLREFQHNLNEVQQAVKHCAERSRLRCHQAAEAEKAAFNDLLASKQNPYEVSLQACHNSQAIILLRQHSCLGDDFFSHTRWLVSASLKLWEAIISQSKWGLDVHGEYRALGRRDSILWSYASRRFGLRRERFVCPCHQEPLLDTKTDCVLNCEVKPGSPSVCAGL
jgi:hypothetical protein